MLKANAVTGGPLLRALSIDPSKIIIKRCGAGNSITYIVKGADRCSENCSALAGSHYGSECFINISLFYIIPYVGQILHAKNSCLHTKDHNI